MASGLNFIVLLCLISGLWTEANAQCAKGSGYDEICPAGWTHFNERCYIFYHSKKEWADAERFCTTLGGNLASIRTRGEYKFLREIIYKATKSHRRTWVGGYDAAKHGVWLWSDGSKFDFTGWGKGQPDNYGGQQGCMEINWSGSDFVNDENCFAKIPFICAKDA